MNKLFVLPLMTLLIVGCTSKNEKAVAQEYDYADVKHLRICWDEILSQTQDSYYAYVYSETCGHCNEIKQEVITYALSHEAFFFISYSSHIPIIDDPLITIDKSEVSDLGIVGTPTLFVINEHRVKENIVGKNSIIATLTNSQE